jgi:hypothetical protein
VDKLGLGVIDKHAIVIILLTLVIAQTVFGFAIPIDTSLGATELFIDIIIFTGYVYLARSIYRLPVAIIASAIYTKREPLRKIRGILRYSWVNVRYGKKKLKSFITYCLILLISPIIVILSFVLITLSFSYANDFPELKKFNTPWFSYFLNVVDRLGVIAIAIIATLPSTTIYVRNIGTIGLCFMVAMYILRGDFTAIVKDALAEPIKSDMANNEQKNETDQEKSQVKYPGIVMNKAYRESMAEEIKKVYPPNRMPPLGDPKTAPSDDDAI